MSKFYITTPIYYVNDQPHIGHAYTTVAADVLARYRRLKGEQVFFLTGTDEHGAKISKSAESLKKKPLEFCNENSAKFQLAWDVLNISNDDFIRTTEMRHQKTVEALLTRLKDSETPAGRPAIYEGEYQGLYCVGCERYLTEKELINGKCPDHQKPPELIKEKNWFFRLSDWQELLLKKIKSGAIKILPETREHEVVGLIKQGLEDIAISRPSVKWGIPVPWDQEQTIYVWIDALINYLSAVNILDESKINCWPADVHLMAKDIVKFHAVIWPALLLALNFDLPKIISSHGFFTIDGQKMSKSLGNVLDPVELSQKYGADAVRYYLMREVPYGNDGDVSVQRLEERYVAELQKGLGNLVARVCSLAGKEQFVPLEFQVEHKKKLGSEIQAKVVQSWEKYEIALDNFAFHEALVASWELISFCDSYITKNEIWKLPDLDQEEFVKMMYNLLETLRHLAWQINPFMPETSDKILKQLLTDPQHLEKEMAKNYSELKNWGGLHPAEIKVKKGEILFPSLTIQKI